MPKTTKNNTSAAVGDHDDDDNDEDDEEEDEEEPLLPSERTAKKRKEHATEVSKRAKSKLEQVRPTHEITFREATAKLFNKDLDEEHPKGLNSKVVPSMPPPCTCRFCSHATRRTLMIGNSIREPTVQIRHGHLSDGQIATTGRTSCRMCSAM